jgi:glycosyltransferase involved in cell wall biosynthesis
MRIAIIIGPFLPVPPVLGGAVEKVHLALATTYRAAGHDVTIISRQYKDFRHDEVVDGIRHIRVPSFDSTASLAVNLLSDFRYSLRAASIQPPADVTVTNSFFLPLVLRRRAAGKIYVQVGRYPKHQMFLYSRADRLQAVSTAVAAAIVRQAPWLRSKVKVIGYAIFDAYFRPRTEPKTENTILFVGRIAREKGIELLLTAFEMLTTARERDLMASWKLRIVGPHEVGQGGDGIDYLTELQTLARPLGSRCEFAGPVFDQDALIRKYQSSSIFVYPSLAEMGESFGVAPLEAMAAGCATVVSNLDCFDDFIEHDVTGMKFDHRGADAAANLASQLARLATDPDLLERMSEAGHRAARNFQTAAIAARMIEDFKSLVADRAG